MCDPRPPQNGVEKFVLHVRSGMPTPQVSSRNELFLSPVQTAVIGTTCAMLPVETSGRLMLAYTCPGIMPCQALNEFNVSVMQANPLAWMSFLAKPAFSCAAL
jgi:hypothetical protein